MTSLYENNFWNLEMLLDNDRMTALLEKGCYAFYIVNLSLRKTSWNIKEGQL